MFASKREIGELKSRIAALENKISLAERMQNSREQQECNHKDTGFDVYTIQGILQDDPKETRLAIKCMSCDKVMRDVGGDELMCVLDAIQK